MEQEVGINDLTQEAEHEINKSADLEQEIKRSNMRLTQEVEQEVMKSALVEALGDALEKHERQMKAMLKEVHVEHEKSLASVVDRAVRQAVAEAAPASPAPFASLPLTEPSLSTRNKALAMSQEIQKKKNEEKEETTKKTAKVQEMPPARPKTQADVAKNNKDIFKNVEGVVAMARVNSRDNLAPTTGWRAILDDFIGPLIQNPKFDYFVALFIFANAGMIAVQTEIAAKDPHGEAPKSFRAVDLFFTIFFCVELALRICVERRRFIIGRNKGWNFFDSFVVFTAVLEEVVSGVASLNTTAIRVLRIMRLVRVVRVIRTLRVFNDLRAMIKGIFASILSLAWALVLLLMIFFVVGIFITQVVTGYRKDQRTAGIEESFLEEPLGQHFGSLSLTMYALYKAITGGDDWSSFADPLFEMSSVMGLIFCVYVAFAVLAVLNVITGVFVDNAIKANQQDADMIIMEQTDARQKHIEAVKSVFQKADHDGSGQLDWPEFQEHLGNPYVQAYFRQLDLDIEGDGAQALFNMLDFDGGGTVDIEEFIFGCGQLKGYARSFDMHRLRHETHKNSLEIHKVSERVDTMFTYIMSNFGILQQVYSKLQEKTSGDQQPPPLAPAVAPLAPQVPVAPEGQPPSLPGSIVVEPTSSVQNSQSHQKYRA